MYSGRQASLCAIAYWHYLAQFCLFPRNEWMDVGACRVGCDSCGLYPIKGHRYKCQDCPDKVGFDLCSKCYDRGLHITGRFNQQHTPGTEILYCSCQCPVFCSQNDSHCCQTSLIAGHRRCRCRYHAFLVSSSTHFAISLCLHLRCATTRACFSPAKPMMPLWPGNADHKMGLVNPQPTVFHIFQVGTPPAALACLQCSSRSQKGWHDDWNQAILALSELRRCCVSVLHAIGMLPVLSLHFSCRQTQTCDMH